MHCFKATQLEKYGYKIFVFLLFDFSLTIVFHRSSLFREVIENLDNETILYVFGDHGMTQTGDHGGETHDEAAAALFIYSKKKIFPTGLVSELL